MPSPPDVDADLAAEQAHVDRAYRCLAAMRDRAEHAADAQRRYFDDGEVDAGAAEAHLRRRVSDLAADVPGLAFGRIDPDDRSGERHHVGRRHVEADDGTTLVVDWRAPVATPFYRATPADPLGLRMRRRFATEGTRVEALFDEVFDDPDSIEASHGGVPDPLLAELERARTGAMRDIVATIQAEQDVVIRSPLDRCLVVQGGPGTGKTAVGLHRAAFLLYEHRGELDRTGVLVVGPNPTFLRYISQVLPSLGETSVRQATVAGLVGRGVAEEASVERAALLGDARMAAVAAAAMAAWVRPPASDQVLEAPTTYGTVRLDGAEVAAVVREVAGRGVAHDVGRSAVRTRLLRLARQALVSRRSDLRRHGEGPELGADAVAPVLDAVWPSVSGTALARRLLTGRSALAAAAEGILDGDEQRRLLRRGARRIADEPWTDAELVVVDECRALAEGVARTYGHVVVDEAQDLSAMALRALARRCPSGSMTVLGDLAQATAPGAQRSWTDALVHLGGAAVASAELAELTVGYRVPAAVLDWANRLLSDAAPGVTPARSVRAGGRAPGVEAVPTLEAVAAAAARLAGERAGEHTSVGLDAPAAVRALLPALDGHVQVVAPAEAKGLEFDAVVVAEPALVVAAAGPDRAAGLRLLYVALTRAVQRLDVVHAEPLPPALTAAGR
jgi:DNA helicase IV